MRLPALRQPPPTESFLSQPLDNRNFRKPRKFPAPVDSPTVQRLYKFKVDMESLDRKASNPKSLLSVRNHRDAAEPLCSRNRRGRIPSDRNVYGKPDTRANAFQVVRYLLGRTEQFFATGKIEHHRIGKILLYSFWSVLDPRRNHPCAVQKSCIG